VWSDTRISAFRFLNIGPSTGLWGTFLVNHETCTYLSPEQFEGRNRSKASDQYALGLLGYEQYNAINHALKLLLDYDTGSQHAAEEIGSVALKHQEYGLGERELRAFEDALLQALRSCGECKPETLEAWRMILAPGFQHMRGALRPAAEPGGS
jgi:serine/threonine protein kinase